jgi:hypothetical protein
MTKNTASGFKLKIKEKQFCQTTAAGIFFSLRRVEFREEEGASTLRSNVMHLFMSSETGNGPGVNPVKLFFLRQ